MEIIRSIILFPNLIESRSRPLHLPNTQDGNRGEAYLLTNDVLVGLNRNKNIVKIILFSNKI
jgi:hypothetical protein